MKIVFFDGYCNLCNYLVDWLIRADKTGELKFASLQGETAKQKIGNESMPIGIDTVVYLRSDKKYETSTAILLILTDLGGVWRVAKFFLFIPKFARDWCYRLIAQNRYRIFGKKDTCRLPSPNELERFLP